MNRNDVNVVSGFISYDADLLQFGDIRYPLRSDPPENSHLTVKKLPKKFIFFKKLPLEKNEIFWQFKKKVNFLAIF